MPPRNYAITNINKVNIEQLHNDVANIDFSPVYTSQDPNLSINYFIESIAAALLIANFILSRA